MNRGKEQDKAGRALISLATFVCLKDKLEANRKLREELIGGLGGEDYTSGLHDEPSVVREIQKIEGQISKVEAILKNAEVLPKRTDTTSVGVGNKIKVRFDDGTQEEFRIGTTIDASYPPTEERWISDESPFGKALLGQDVNVTVSFDTPDRKKLSVEILEILPEI